MAVTGVFNADFSSFFDAVQKSEIHLKDLATGAAKVEGGLSKMADSFSGRKIIQEATQMAEVFERAGGASAFTEKELARMGATGAEAVEKLTALGREVPPGIQAIATATVDATRKQEELLDSIGAAGGRIDALGDSASDTSGSVSGLSKEYQKFDGALQAAGINIGPQVKGLEDIANAAGKTTKEMGLLGTAGLAAGAFMTGWKIGEFIDGLTGASTAVEKLTRSIMGWGDVATETAAAQQDTINRALSLGAQEGIKYADAIKFIETQLKKNADASIDWATKLATAQREVRNLSDAQRAEIDVAIQAGATTEQLTAKYGLNALALNVLADRQRLATAEQTKLNAALREEAEARDKRNKSNEDGVALMERDARLAADRAAFDKEQAAIQKGKLDAGKAYVEQMSEVARVNREATEFEKGLVAEQKQLDAENKNLVASLEQVSEAHTAAGQSAAIATTGTSQGYTAVTTSVEMSAEAIRAWITLQQYSAKVNAILKQNSLFTSTSQWENIANIPVPSFASGVQNFQGGMAKVHEGEMLVNLPRGTDVVPKHQMQMSNTFNLVDTESNLARRVSELIMRSVQAGTQLGTA